MTQTVLSYEPIHERERMATHRHALLALLCTAAAIAYVQRSGIAVTAAAMQGELGLDKVRFGSVLAGWGLGYALAQIPSGWLADRWGSRKALVLFALLWSTATGLIAVARGYHSLLILWTVMGLAQAGIFPCSARAIKRSFPDSSRASATGLLASCMAVGGAIAPGLTGLLLAVVTWRSVFLLLALPGIAWAVFFHQWFGAGRNGPSSRKNGGAAVPDGFADLTVAQPPATTGTRVPVSAGGAVLPTTEAAVWRVMLGSGSMWVLCGQQFLRAAAMMFFATWFPTFLRESRGVTVAASGFLTTLAGAGAVGGALLGGIASDKVLAKTGNARLSRQGLAVVGMTACAALILWAYFVANTMLAVSIISAGAFCGTFGGVSGYIVAMDFGGRRVATVFSVMNMCGNIGAAAFPLAIGWLVQHMRGWGAVLFIFAGIFAVDAILWAILNPKQPLFEEE